MAGVAGGPRSEPLGHGGGSDISTWPGFSSWNALPEYLVEPPGSSVPLGWGYLPLDCYLPVYIWDPISEYLFLLSPFGGTT